MEKRNIIIALLISFILSGLNISIIANPILNTKNNFYTESFNNVDYDPLTNIKITVIINSIRALKQIDDNLSADFFVKIFINNLEFISPVFNDTKYLYDLNFSVTADVPDDIEIVGIKIQLYDKDGGKDEYCDISGDKIKSDIELTYSVKTGNWIGDDYLGDPSGYGRLNGCDDGSIYTPEKDCELWFNIYQNDLDSDGIPYWIEVNTYGTDPTVDNRGEDPNSDGISIEWDWKYGYDPFAYDNHSKLDTDNDGLNNLEEYTTSIWESDPFRKDLFIEIDQMDVKKDNNSIIMPNSTKELLSDVYNRRNIVFHLDDGCMGGGEIIPYSITNKNVEILKIYKKYFLNNNSNNSKRSIFRYAVILDKSYCNAKAFVGEGSFINSDIRGINSFFITIDTIEKVKNKTNYSLDFIYACYILHETGHTLGIDIFNPMGCDNIFTTKPWMFGYWLYGNYKSVMNYRYTIHLLDYSDGNHGKRDYNDWGNIDLTWFENSS